ncbi:DUF397 domain-containing protein [Actinopolyspora alba]|uniref:DUF397 domain-containing protein n=1 Tax=Actinopolyspora alba TaxID=673379 RepID=UPI000B84C62C
MHTPTNWCKSSYSGQDTNCVEIGRVRDGAAVRDTKDRSTGYFTITGQQWVTFLNAVKTNRFD